MLLLCRMLMPSNHFVQVMHIEVFNLLEAEHRKPTRRAHVVCTRPLEERHLPPISSKCVLMGLQFGS